MKPMFIFSMVVTVFDASAIFVNALLLLIYFKCPARALGDYRNNVLVFIVIDILYAVIHLLTQPISLLSDGMFLFLSTGIISPTPIGNAASTAFSTMLIIICIHVTNCFIHRYVALCGGVASTYFATRWGIRVRHFMNVFGVLNFILICLVVIRPEPYLIDEFEGIVREMLDIDMSRMAFVGSSMKRQIWNPVIMFLYAETLGILLFMTAVMVYCVHKTMKTLKTCSLSANTFRLHKQMFNLLVWQCALPVSSLFLPVMVTFVLQIVGIKITSIGIYILGVIYCVFPLCNPFIIVYFIKDYRNFVLRKLRLSRIDTSLNMHSLRGNDTIIQS